MTGWFIQNAYVLLASQSILGATVYFVGAKLLKFESAEYLWQTAQHFLLPKLKCFV
jgi:hypothetical protein